MANPCLHPLALLRRLLPPAALLLGVAQAHAGLVLHYAFDETSGTTAADSSGSGNTGTLYRGGLTPWVSGRIGNALSIDSATRAYVRATGYKGVTGTSAGSLAYWQKTTSPNDHDYAVFWGDSSNKMVARTSFSGGGKALLSMGGHNVNQSNSGPDITDDTWHHVAYTFPASSPNNLIKVYVDGTLLTGTGGNGVTINTGSSSDVFIGTGNGSGSRYEGLLDDIRMYDHELSASEVSALASMGGPGAPEPAETFAFLGLLTAFGLGFREWRSRRKAKAA